VLNRLGSFTVRRRRLVLALTALFMVVAAVLGTGAFGVLKSEGFADPNSESERATALLDERFDAGDPDVVLVVTANAGDVDAADAAAAGTAVADRLSALEHVDDVTSYWGAGAPPTLRSDDATSALVLARIDGGGGDEVEDEVIADIRAALEGDQGAVTVGVGGSAAVGADIGSTIEGDLARAELIAIPITLLLLLLVFGGLVAAALPLFVGVVAVLGTFLSLYVLGSITDVSIFAINLTTALGLGLAIDYSLFIVSRFREEVRNGRSVEQAVVRTVETAGRTIAISALTVAASLCALLIFPQYFLRSFAYSGVAVVILAMFASLISLPALLAVVGHRIDSLRVLPRRAPRRDEDGLWYRIATRVMRRPLPVAIVVIVVLLALGSPFLRVQFGSPDDRVLAESADARVVSDLLRSDFSGNAAESFPVVVDDLAASGSGTEDAGELAARISALDGVARVESASGTYEGGSLLAGAAPGDRSDQYRADGATWMSVVPAIEMGSSAGEDLVGDIRGLDTTLDVSVGGSAAALVDSKASISSRLPLAIAIIVVATTLLLFLLSGSLLVPVKALLLNLLSLTATFGAMVWIFQDGNLSGLLGFTATGSIDTSMPILMFCIAFGLSMDYEVFLLSRIKEEHDRTGDNDHAVALGIERTGRIVTAAALLLSITFFAFGTSGVSFIKMFGIGLGLAVLMDAFVIRGALVPAFMKLAGEANWWAPAPLRRFHDRFGLREGEAPEAAEVPTADADPAEVRRHSPSLG
jgi:RND superfamily putative drug exporter